MMIRVRRLISKPLDLKNHGNDERGAYKERQNIGKGPILDSGVHPDQRDEQQSWDTKGYRRENVERICCLDRLECLL